MATAVSKVALVSSFPWLGGSGPQRTCPGHLQPHALDSPEGWYLLKITTSLVEWVTAKPKDKAGRLFSRAGLSPGQLDKLESLPGLCSIDKEDMNSRQKLSPNEVRSLIPTKAQPDQG